MNDFQILLTKNDLEELRKDNYAAQRRKFFTRNIDYNFQN